MKYYIVAGEASGDLHASNLMKEIKRVDKNCSFRYFGGDLMQSQGGTLIKHYKELAFMGIWEILKNIRTIICNIKLCKKDVIDWQPDRLILVDYPSFNLRIAKKAKGKGLQVSYYISPKIWVWKKNRIKQIKKYVDKMFVIFPFEVDFYRRNNFEVEYVGNPTANIVSKERNCLFDLGKFRVKNKLSTKPIIALLPGSREHEVKKMLPIMADVSRYFSDYQFVVGGIGSLPRDLYLSILKKYDIKIIWNSTYDILRVATAAIVTSGTATLETALFNVPQVVCYKTSKLTYFIGKLFVKTQFFSLVNILLQKESVVELLQNNLKQDVVSELKRILMDDIYKQSMLDDYSSLLELLGHKNASENIVKMLV